MKERPEKFRPKLVSNPDLCDADSMVFQLSFQANREKLIMGFIMSP